MITKDYWADGYVKRRRTAEEALKHIKSGQRVFIGSFCGEPQHLVGEFINSSYMYTDIEIVRLLSPGTSRLASIAEKTKDRSLNLRTFYSGSVKHKTVVEHTRFIAPMNMAIIPRLFKSRQLPVQTALIQVSPPDDFGWMSLGVSVDITLAAALSADFVIAQVNSKMPRIFGQSFIHVNDINLFVEYDEPLITVETPPELESANEIALLLARLIEDGSTMHISPGATLNATLLALSGKNDIGVHTEYITDAIMHLVSQGIITNKKKGNKEGRTVAAGAIGTENLYEFLHDNLSIDFQPSDYVNNSAVIASHNKMVSLNVAGAIDLTGQVAADPLANNTFNGAVGTLDFARGALLSKNGKSIIMIPSTSGKGKKSRIVPRLKNTAVLIPRNDVHYVVSEYGTFNLLGKSIQERAMGMISIAHPDFRDELFQQAKELGVVSKGKTLNESLYGVYPRKLEEVIEKDGQKITIRPAKPVDERRIQEHFYTLDKNDVIARFFYEKTSFFNDEIAFVSHVDYIRDLTLIAIVGEFGFGKVVAVGEYLLETGDNIAEVAFSVTKEWQGKNLGKILIKKLSEAAIKNGISGFTAYTAPLNQGMIKLFNTLPYKVKTSFEENMLKLFCKFDQPNSGSL